MSEEVGWESWIKAHHAIGCSERNRSDALHCRYRAAHLKTAKEFMRLIEADGWRLCRVPVEVKSLPMFGDL